MDMILVACAVFLLCFLVDKGFSRIFRNQAQHKSGLSVRLNKRYATAGIILFALAVIAGFSGISGKDVVLTIGAVVVFITSVILIVYYLSFGIYYDDDSFILSTFGKKSVTYQFSDIQSQQIYRNGGSILIDLYLKDGRSVAIQFGMEGGEAFLNKAFEGWCRQKGLKEDECTFHDPSNSCWFPAAEEK